MGFDINLNKKVKEIFTRTAGEQHNDAQTRRIIQAYAEQYTAETGSTITEDDIVQAMTGSLWSVSINPFSNAGGCDADDGSNSIDSKLEAARMQRIQITGGDGAQLAFGLTDGNVNATASASGAGSQVDAVKKSSETAVSDAEKGVDEAERKEENAQRGVADARKKADNDNANASIKVSATESAAAATKARGEADVAKANKDEQDENEKAKVKYQNAQSNVELAKKNSEQVISDAKSKSEKNNKSAEDELNSAKTAKNGTATTVSNLETQLGDMGKTVAELKGVLSNNPDATEDDVEKYNKALEKQKKLENELEKAKKEDENAAKKVTEAEEKVKTTKQEGEDLVRKATEEEEAKVKAAEALAEVALAELTVTENSGQDNSKRVAATAEQNNKQAQVSVVAAQTEAQRVKVEGDNSVKKANNALASASKKVEDEENKVKDVKADGERAVASAKIKEENPESQSEINTTTSALAKQLSIDENKGKISETPDSAAAAIEKAQIVALEAAKSTSHDVFREVDIRNAAKQVAAEKGTSKSDEDVTKPKKKLNTFGI